MKVEAYLGPNKPETVASGEVTAEQAKSMQYAVARFTRENPDSGELVGVYSHYGPALLAVNQWTGKHWYGVLCQVRLAANQTVVVGSFSEGGAQ